MNRLTRRGMFLSLAALSLTACAPRPSPNPLSREARAALRIARIEVTTTGATFESRRASDAAGNLGPDLQARMRQEFSDRMRPDGIEMSVEIARMNLAGSVRTAFGDDRSRLQGTVRLIDRSGRLLAIYPVEVEVGTAAETRRGAVARAAVTTVDGFYRALLSGFARQTRGQILGDDSAGQRLVRQFGNR